MNIEVPSESIGLELLFQRLTGRRTPSFICVLPIRYITPGATANHPE